MTLGQMRQALLRGADAVQECPDSARGLRRLATLLAQRPPATTVAAFVAELTVRQDRARREKRS